MIVDLNLPIASFCPIEGKLTYVRRGVHSEFHRCRIHGPIILVPYYANHTCTWACPSCLDDKFRNKYLEPTEIPSPLKAKVEKCDACAATTNLEDCEMCGRTICPTHRIEGICEECQYGIDCCGSSGAWCSL